MYYLFNNWYYTVLDSVVWTVVWNLHLRITFRPNANVMAVSAPFHMQNRSKSLRSIGLSSSVTLAQILTN
jgi:hypothetical protein